jgi:hypothetical protein
MPIILAGCWGIGTLLNIWKELLKKSSLLSVCSDDISCLWILLSNYNCQFKRGFFYISNFPLLCCYFSMDKVHNWH